MSVAIIGGLDRLKQSYLKKGRDMGWDVRVFSKPIPNLRERLSGVQAIVVFTRTVAHQMVTEALEVSKKYNIPISRVHSSSVSSLKRCLVVLDVDRLECGSV